MPQLNPEFFVSQVFWLVVFFTFLFIFLWRISLPRIAKVLENRRRKIDDELETAKDLQKQANDIEKSINLRLNKVKEESNLEIRDAISSIQEDTNSKLEILDKDLDQKVLNAEIEITKNKDNQITNIDNEISNIVKIIVSKVADIDISDNDINSALKVSKERYN